MMPEPPVINKPHRKCSRDGCNNFASQSNGGAVWAKLCHLHNADRRARQQRTACQPNCRCGNKAPMDSDKCRACQERDDKYNQSQSINRKFNKCIARLRELSRETEGSDIGAELEGIVDELEYVQAVI
jgi:hypothetical protein